MPSSFAIGLFTDRLEIAMWRRGRVIAARRYPAALGEISDTEQWISAVHELGPSVRQMVAEMCRSAHGHGRSAFVVYASPGAVGDCMSFPVHSASQARAAASLAVLDSMQCSIETVLSSALFIERDSVAPSPARATPATTSTKTDNPSRRSHVVAAAECEPPLMAIQTLVEAAGLRFRGAVPIQAVVAARALVSSDDPRVRVLPVDGSSSNAACTQADLNSARPIAHLHVAEAAAFLLIRDAAGHSRGRGGLRFTRSIGIGTTALAASLLRRSRPDAEDSYPQIGSVPQQSSTGLDPDTARITIHEFGLPSTPDAQHELTGLTARDVLPLLQPLVQRLVVELRQSLRFALDSAERSRVTFIISGPGASVPGLATAIARELNVPVYVHEQSDGSRYDPQQPASPLSDLGDAIAAWPSRARGTLRELALMPRELAVENSARRIRRAFWAGAAAALVFIALDAGRLTLHLTHAQMAHDSRAAHATLPAHSSGVAFEAADVQEMMAAIESAREFRRVVERATSHRVDFRACMHELSQLTPPTVRFLSVNVRPGPSSDEGTAGQVETTIAGIARGNGEVPPRSELERFVAELRSSPLFSDVALANIHVETGDQLAQRFELRFATMPTPIAWQPGSTPHPAQESPHESGIAAAAPELEGGEP